MLWNNQVIGPIGPLPKFWMRTRWSKASLSTQLARQRHSLHKLLGVVFFLQGSHYFWDSAQPQLRIPSFQVCLLRSLRSFCTGPSALIAPFHKGFSSRCISELAVRFGPSVPIRPAQLWSKLCNCQHCVSSTRCFVLCLWMPHCYCASGLSTWSLEVVPSQIGSTSP